MTTPTPSIIKLFSLLPSMLAFIEVLKSKDATASSILEALEPLLPDLLAIRDEYRAEAEVSQRSSVVRYLAALPVDEFVKVMMASGQVDFLGAPPAAPAPANGSATEAHEEEEGQG